MVALITSARLLAGMVADKVRARFGEERGQDLLEYALLGGVIALAIVTAAIIFTPALNSMALGIRDCIDFTGSTLCDPGP